METKIPKIIHYCWLSNNPVPAQLQAYMETWHKLMPDYEFIKWDFTRFEKSSSVWVSEAFDNKKYAFAADYIRMYALYTMGGIYMDMDVEVLKPFDDFLGHSYFLCNERNGDVPEVATFGAKKGSDWIRLILDYYKDRHFVLPDGTFDTATLPRVVKKVLLSHGYSLMSVESPKELPVDSDENKVIYMLPYDYFSPKSFETGKVDVTENTYSIHRFASSWIPWYQKLEQRFWRAVGMKKNISISSYLRCHIQRFVRFVKK